MGCFISKKKSDPLLTITESKNKDSFIEVKPNQSYNPPALNKNPEKIKTTPTPEEISMGLALISQRLWQLDVNRLQPGTDIILNTQKGKSIHGSGDFALEPLFSKVDKRFMEMPTYKAFMALLDNYTAQTGVKELITDEEKNENSHFLDSILDTPVMQYCHKYLVAKNLAPNTKIEFKSMLHTLWFGLYRREKEDDSSGFEHVFLGEVRDGSVSGMHNWIQMYLEEVQGRFDYMGYINSKRSNDHKLSPTSDQHLLTIQFKWLGCLKKVSSSLIGVSPEFEIALYTICFFTEGEKHVVLLGPYRVELTCHKYNSKGKLHIGTAFPSEAPISTSYSTI